MAYGKDMVSMRGVCPLPNFLHFLSIESSQTKKIP